MGLPGWVQNTADGVHIEYNADEEIAKKFYASVLDHAPPLALVTFHHQQAAAPVVYESFNIVDSSVHFPSKLLLSPDFATCERCRAEMADPANRRYLYAFTTCTQCGPRFSIVGQLPYDRANTTMADFGMCSRCEAEYHDPADRRHFSQTNSCPDCAVRMQLWDNRHNLVEEAQLAILHRICSLWNDGKIVAIKGIGGYLLTCDAANERAVGELRLRKYRPAKPFALMFPDLVALKSVAHVSPAEARELTSVAAPIVLLRLLENGSNNLAVSQIFPGLTRAGAMLPYAPLYELLLRNFARPIVATSGNVSHAPIVFTDEAALGELSTLADYVLVHDRAIVAPQDDSVVAYTRYAQRRIVLRRSRGFAPYFGQKNPLRPESTLLAMGAMSKSTFALAHLGDIHVSQYLGDTDDYDAQISYEKTLDRFLNLFQAQPAIVLADRHPGYFTSKLGKALAGRWNGTRIEVPHHEAHFAAVLGEHDLLEAAEPILGVVWDGTGLGDDQQIWGGEFFIFREKKFSRIAHFAYFDHFLGDKMATEPRLSALALANDLSSARPILQPKFSATEWRNYQKLIAGNSLKTSSVGRLFDAVASLLGLIDRASYEGEAALLLEEAASRFFRDELVITVEWLGPGDPQELLSALSLVNEVIGKIKAGEEVARIAAWFHVRLVVAIREVALRHGGRKVCFSGGVFQNGLLVDLLVKLLGADYELFFNRELSPNDENISFGQLMWYQATAGK